MYLHTQYRVLILNIGIHMAKKSNYTCGDDYITRLNVIREKLFIRYHTRMFKKCWDAENIQMDFNEFCRYKQNITYKDDLLIKVNKLYCAILNYINELNIDYTNSIRHFYNLNVYSIEIHTVYSSYNIMISINKNNFLPVYVSAMCLDAKVVPLYDHWNLDFIDMINKASFNTNDCKIFNKFKDANNDNLDE